MVLKDKRIEKGLTQEKTARAIDMNLRTYQLIEKTNNCSLQNAFSLATFFGCSIEELFKEKKR